MLFTTTAPSVATAAVIFCHGSGDTGPGVRQYLAMVGNPELVRRFAMMCQTRYLQHMILCGPPGVGKSRLVQLLIDNLLGKAQHEAVLQFNSADERSNQVIREKIHQFVPKKVTVSSPKLVVFRQAEQLGEGVQQIMRRLMECHYHHAVFIFVCSDLNGMLETLQSRCHIFRFAPVSVAQQVPYLRTVAAKEGVAADDAALGLIATLSNGDMRSSLNYLQAACCALEAVGGGGAALELEDLVAFYREAKGRFDREEEFQSRRYISFGGTLALAVH